MRVRPLDEDAAQRLARDVAVDSIAQVTQWLLQNSLDAGADEVEYTQCITLLQVQHFNTQVTVHLHHCDAHSVMVEDNGCGIARNDLPALPGGTHAAGRRGTALARIASVATITITSRPRGSLETCYKAVSLQEDVREGLATAPRRQHGTTIEVAELFSTQPVRARHAARQERDVAAVQQVVLQAAACCLNVAVRMTLGAQRRVVVDLPKAHSPEAPLQQLWALPLDALCRAHVRRGPLTIDGVVGVPASAAHDATLSTLWVDGCTSDAREAVEYLSDMLADVLYGQRGRKRNGGAAWYARYAVAATLLRPQPMDRGEVSSSQPKHSVALFALHVRGAQGAPLPWGALCPLLNAVAVQCWGHWMPLALVQRLQDAAGTGVQHPAAGMGLQAGSGTSVCSVVGVPVTNHNKHRAMIDNPSRPRKRSFHARAPGVGGRPAPRPALSLHTASAAACDAADAPPVVTLRVLCDLWQCHEAVPSSITREELQRAQLLEQVDNRWLAVRYGSTVALVDQHGADERVRLEHLTATYAVTVGHSTPRAHHLHRLMSAVSRGMPPSTTLPSPLIVRLTAGEAAALEQHGAQLQRWGWRWRLRSTEWPCAALLTEVPCILGTALVAADFKLDATRGTEQLPAAHARLLASKACRTAVMFGSALPRPRCQRLLDELRATTHCFSCAHGRPTVVPLVQLDVLRGGQGVCRDGEGSSIEAFVQRLRRMMS